MGHGHHERTFQVIGESEVGRMAEAPAGIRGDQPDLDAACGEGLVRPKMVKVWRSCAGTLNDPLKEYNGLLATRCV